MLFFRHYVSVLIHTYEKDYLPITYFYKLIPLGSRSTGQIMLEAVLQNFKDDGILPLVKDELVAAVTDGDGNKLINLPKFLAIS